MLSMLLMVVFSSMAFATVELEEIGKAGVTKVSDGTVEKYLDNDPKLTFNNDIIIIEGLEHKFERLEYVSLKKKNLVGSYSKYVIDHRREIAKNSIKRNC